MKDYKNYYIVSASPEEVYLALTLESTIMLWTGDKAEMVAEPGTEFSMWDGSIIGKNIEFDPNKKIVQEWYFDNPIGQESIVTIKLHVDKKGTSLELSHTNIPDEAYEDIVEGWVYGFIDPIREVIEE